MHRKKSKRILNVSNELFLVTARYENRSNIFVSGEQRRRALAESGVTVVAHITKDRELVAWAQSTGRAVYIGRNYRGWREAGWGNPFRSQTHAPEEHDRVIALYTRHLDDNPILLARLPELCGGKVLLCWCHPLPCHGDVLAKRANAKCPASSAATFTKARPVSVSGLHLGRLYEKSDLSRAHIQGSKRDLARKPESP